MKVQIPKDKYFYINTKEEMVDAMRQPITAALKLVIDQLLDQIDTAGFDYKEIKEDEPVVITNARQAIVRYEGIIDKLQNNKELDQLDYDSIVLVCKTCSIIFENHIQGLKDSEAELSKIAWKLAHMKLASQKLNTVLEESKNLTK